MDTVTVGDKETRRHGDREKEVRITFDVSRLMLDVSRKGYRQ